MKSTFRKRISLKDQNLVNEVTSLISKFNLNTVCQSAKCPNIFECFASGTATFMIMGDVCTRNCRFCAVKSGKPKPLEPDEPYSVAKAAKELALSYVVVTSVTRDDLPDGGASHFASTIEAVRAILPEAGVEALVPDFKGSQEAIKKVIQAKPTVFNHNVETVPRLYRLVRPEANYKRSLKVLKIAKEIDDSIITKSGLIVGLGEEQEEILKVMEDLVNVGCNLLTIGQYLSPSEKHIPVHKFWEQEEFDKLANIGREIGFKEVLSGFFVRSSYKAKDIAEKSRLSLF